MNLDPWSVAEVPEISGTDRRSPLAPGSASIRHAYVKRICGSTQQTSGCFWPLAVWRGARTLPGTGKLAGPIKRLMGEGDAARAFSQGTMLAIKRESPTFTGRGSFSTKNSQRGLDFQAFLVPGMTG